MVKKKSAKDYFPEKINLSSLQKASKTCRGCHLYKYGKQTVFGEGSKDASLIVVGEIPGQKEDETGHPFTGPAGTLLRKAIDLSGLNPKDIYYTNVVKHFKFTYMNKKKLHRSPVAAEINACKPWLEAELDVIHPQVILCLGLIAAKTLISGKIGIRADRGKWFPFNETTKIIITFHPSAILRARTDDDRHAMKKIFMRDIRKVAVFLNK